MGNRLEGKVAIVTGGGRGIGRSISTLLAKEGASVIVNDHGTEVDGSGRSNEPVDNMIKDLKAAGFKVTANYADVSKMDGGEEVVQKAIDTYGQLDILVNSAGSLIDRMIYQMTPEDFDKMAEHIQCD